MANKVTLSVPAMPVQNNDVTFEVQIDGVGAGKLKISKGGVDWYKKGAQNPTRKLTWKRFRTLMEE
jgi:hypothetical protein